MAKNLAPPKTGMRGCCRQYINVFAPSPLRSLSEAGSPRSQNSRPRRRGTVSRSREKRLASRHLCVGRWDQCRVAFLLPPFLPRRPPLNNIHANDWSTWSHRGGLPGGKMLKAHLQTREACFLKILLYLLSLPIEGHRAAGATPGPGGNSLQATHWIMTSIRLACLTFPSTSGSIT